MTRPARKDRRKEIIEAGLAVLRSHGYAGFTQPRVAAAVGLRQSHLTYYYPTRADLLAAVTRAAVDAQIAALDALAESGSVEETAAMVARLSSRRETTRVLLALAQAAEEAPELREMFRELADVVLERLAGHFARLGIPATETNRLMLHALAIGLAVLDLAVGRPDRERLARGAVEAALSMMQAEGAATAAGD